MPLASTMVKSRTLFFMPLSYRAFRRGISSRSVATISCTQKKTGVKWKTCMSQCTKHTTMLYRKSQSGDHTLGMNLYAKGIGGYHTSKDVRTNGCACHWLHVASVSFQGSRSELYTSHGPVPFATPLEDKAYVTSYSPMFFITFSSPSHTSCRGCSSSGSTHRPL